ncbi:MAG: BMP family ABC transporter substrate-binding protein [Acidimicrobiales bacterium]
MRKTKRFAALALTASLFVVAACGDDDEETTSTTAAASDTTAAGASDTTAAAGGEGISACEVTDVGGVDDKGFNQSAYAGLEQAKAELGAEIDLLESSSDADYAPNIDAFVKKDCDVIVTVGFLLGGATAAAAKANPDQQFAIIDSDANDDNGTPDDFSDDINLENVRALNFSTDQPSFVAGYLAAGMTKTGKVATYGGINIPPVTIFMTGFLNGVKYYNEQKGTTVEVLGWDGTEGSFAGNFESLDDGKKLAQGFADEGADIIFPVAGPVGLGSSAYAKEVGGIRIIGVDVDMYVSNDKEKEVYLTSVLKNIDAAVFDTVKNVADSGDPGDDYLGTFANGGVGIADYHDQAGDVPAELQAEVTDIIAKLTSGELKAS